MGRRHFRVLAGLLTVALAGCAAPIAPAGSALSLGSTASAVAPASVTAPARTAKISSIRTTDATKGVITVIGTLSPAPKAGTRRCTSGSRPLADGRKSRTGTRPAVA